VRAVRPRTATELSFLGLGSAAERFLRGAAGTTRLAGELAAIVTLETSWDGGLGSRAGAGRSRPARTGSARPAARMLRRSSARWLLSTPALVTDNSQTMSRSSSDLTHQAEPCTCDGLRFDHDPVMRAAIAALSPDIRAVTIGLRVEEGILVSHELRGKAATALVVWTQPSGVTCIGAKPLVDIPALVARGSTV